MSRRTVTLIELLFAVIIVGILGATVAISLSGSTDDAEEAWIIDQQRKLNAELAVIYAIARQEAALLDEGLEERPEEWAGAIGSDKLPVWSGAVPSERAASARVKQSGDELGYVDPPAFLNTHLKPSFVTRVGYECLMRLDREMMLEHGFVVVLNGTGLWAAKVNESDPLLDEYRSRGTIPLAVDFASLNRVFNPNEFALTYAWGANVSPHVTGEFNSTLPEALPLGQLSNEDRSALANCVFASVSIGAGGVPTLETVSEIGVFAGATESYRAQLEGILNPPPPTSSGDGGSTGGDTSPPPPDSRLTNLGNGYYQVDHGSSVSYVSSSHITANGHLSASAPLLSRAEYQRESGATFQLAALPGPRILSPVSGQSFMSLELPYPVLVEWEAVPMATGYIVKWEGQEIPIDSGEETSILLDMNQFGSQKVMIKTKNYSEIYGAYSSQTFSFQQGLLSPPYVLTPQADQEFVVTSVPTSVMVEWKRVKNAAGYVLSAGGQTIEIDDGMVKSHAVDLGLGSHTIKMLTVNHSGATGDWSDEFSINVTAAILAGPSLVAPSNQEGLLSHTSPTSVEFSWDPVEGATGYQVKVNGSVFTPVGTNTTYSRTLAWGNHTWAVRTRNIAGVYGDWSEERSFNLSAPLLAAPDPVGPTYGQVIDTQPTTFEWKPVEHATGYMIYLWPDQIGFHEISSGSQKTLSMSLGLGNYEWYICTKNGEGNYGDWQYVGQFSVVASPLPAPELLSPVADGSVQADGTTARVGFSWSQVGGATGYELEVGGSTYRFYSGTEVNAYVDLGWGDQSWRMRTRNASYAYGSWSSYQSFRVLAPLLAAPSTLSPSSGTETTNTSVTFSWPAVEHATGYRLYISPAVNGSYYHYITSGTQLTLNLSLGNYQWLVSTKNPDNAYGNWSSWQYLKVNAPLQAAPALQSPASGATIQATGSTHSVTFTWAAVSGAAGYQLEVDGVTYGIGSGSTTSQAVTVGWNSHSWRMRTLNSTGQYGNWSGSRSFTINAPILAAPTLQSPASGTVYYASGTTYYTSFIWQAVTGSNGYQIEIGGALYTVSSGTATAYYRSLAWGSHTWRMRTRNATGQYGAWSASRTLTVRPTIGTSTHISPASGATVTGGTTPIIIGGKLYYLPRMMTFEWSGVTYATGYELQIYSYSSGTYADFDVTGGGTTQSMIVPAAGMHVWRVRAYADVDGISRTYGSYTSWRTLYTD